MDKDDLQKDPDKQTSPENEGDLNLLPSENLENKNLEQADSIGPNILPSKEEKKQDSALPILEDKPVDTLSEENNKPDPSLTDSKQKEERAAKKISNLADSSDPEKQEKKIEKENKEPDSPNTLTKENVPDSNKKETLEKEQSAIKKAPNEKPETSAPLPSKTAPQVDKETIFHEKLSEVRKKANQARQNKTIKNQEKILDFAKSKNKINNQDVRELTGLKSSQARFYLNKLEKQKKLLQIGKKGQKVYYMPILDK